MEVLKHGNTYKEVECPKCGALLSYCKSDVKVDNKTRYAETGYNFYTATCHIEKTYITCPECKRMIILKKTLDGEEMKW